MAPPRVHVYCKINETGKSLIRNHQNAKTALLIKRNRKSIVMLL